MGEGKIVGVLRHVVFAPLTQILIATPPLVAVSNSAQQSTGTVCARHPFTAQRLQDPTGWGRGSCEAVTCCSQNIFTSGEEENVASCMTSLSIPSKYFLFIFKNVFIYLFLFGCWLLHTASSVFAEACGHL